MATTPLPSGPLNVQKAFTGKRLLFAGATGFLGKVSLSMFLHHYGDALERIYVLVRRGSAASAERRFFDKIAPSEPFQPIRDRLGEDGAMAYFHEKCRVLDGDITDERLGLSEPEVEALRGQVDVVINCAGLVSFDPSLELGLKVNTLGVQNVVDVCLSLDVPLIHVSTAFVAGNRSGLVFEDEEVVGYFPRKNELDGRDFSLDQELADCEKLVAQLREKAEDRALTSTFRQQALERLAQEGRNENDEKTLRLAVGRERKLWLSQELTRAGMERAKHWGWPNTYTYTKSLGEQVIARTPALSYSILRPSIVESAVRFPFPGWNEGFTTSAPLCFACITGQPRIPAGEQTILDIIPVDQIAAALIASTAQQLETRERRVYQLASGDMNPFYAARSVELVGLYRRQHFRNKATGNKLWNELLARLEPKPVSREAYEALSAPLFIKGAQVFRRFLSDVKPGWGAPRVSALVEKSVQKLELFENQAQSLVTLVDLFMPFIWENRYIFRCDNTRALYARMPPEDRERIPWDPEALDWRLYFLNTHLPGLEKYVFPGLEEETQRRTTAGAHRDLLELLDAATHAFRHRVALRFVVGEKEERFTYGELHRYASRVGSFLLRLGVQHQDRVLLVSENRPEWGMAFFGILRAGATSVPVDPELSTAEVVNIARRSDARACLISEEAAAQLPGLHRAFAEAGLAVHVFSLAQAMAGDDAYPDRLGPVRRSASGDDVASLLFTSGTTGQPKGVMLTHRNFTSLVAKLLGQFDLNVGDGLLSVLPLHHTFEFSCGFLLPLTRGAEITYIDELNADRLGDVFETGRITAMIGVPALWQLLHKKITQEIVAKPTVVEQGMNALMAANAELRNRTQFNLGKLLFWPVHKKFGGKLKFMVSGGSALPDEVHKAFHALGFNITEGYGLTEAAPVLTVSSLTNARQPGTVGKPLPGIELKIENPDADGIGEVWAKGPNVMAGYFQDRESSDAVLKGGWLLTGDLGRLDGEGKLFLVGRKKDVIIDANGKNVFPDELEEVYASHPHIKELSIVGLPDDSGGEKVACLCVPDYGERAREEVRRELETHFRETSAQMPFYRRVKVLRLWEGELPRTSTRKVKRKQVVDELKRLERLAQSSERARVQSQASAGSVEEWLFPLIAEVLGAPLVNVQPESSLAGDLGFDSLMLSELSVALEQAGVPVHRLTDLSQVVTVGDLRQWVASAGKRTVEPAKTAAGAEQSAQKDKEIPVPELVGTLGRQLLSFGQKVLYGGVFDVKITGKSFIPQNRNFLVVANHTSHLDMGLVKVVLGDQGERLAALAARDYFFDTPLKRAYFENFTHLIPMDRSGSVRESLQLAGEALTQGLNLLIFPEGTRSPSGELLEFKSTLGYLALTYNVDVLPLYLDGTYDALPKGALFPKKTALEVRIGPALEVDQLRVEVQGMARSEGYRRVTALTEEAVRALKDKRVLTWAPSAKTSTPDSSSPQRVTQSPRHEGEG